MHKREGYITNFGYLSIDKEYLNSLPYNTGVITIEGTTYDVNKLKSNITYSDNRTYFRWSVQDYTRSTAKI